MIYESKQAAGNAWIYRIKGRAFFGMPEGTTRRNHQGVRIPSLTVNAKRVVIWLSRILMIALLTLCTGCAVKVMNATRLQGLAERPQKLTFIWSGSSKVVLSNLPAFGVAMIGDRFSDYFQNYATEYSAFGEAIAESLSEHPTLRTPDVIAVPLGNPEADLIAKIQQVPIKSAVVVMYAERVTAYCKPGCYSFNVRVSYMAPGNHRKIWTALLDVPPKKKHSDSFRERATDFANVIAEKLKAENLTP
jgi:hypothetical protein